MSDLKTIEAGAKSSDVADGTMKNINLSEHDLELELALASYVPGSDAEKRLVRKMDFIMMPALWFMYILAYIDRQNIVGQLVLCLDIQLTFPKGQRKSRWHGRGPQLVRRP